MIEYMVTNLPTFFVVLELVKSLMERKMVAPLERRAAETAHGDGQNTETLAPDGARVRVH